VVFLALDPSTTVPQNPTVMRDLTGIGHHGNGDVEYLLSTTDQLAQTRQLMSQAYQRAQ
jgi:predicted transport protein